MEGSRDSRRTTISPANGLPRRRQRITTLRDSPDKDSQMELQERSIDRERFQKKDQDQDREISKRRRVDKSGVQQRICGGEGYIDNESTDSSDEEYYEEKEERQNRMNQPLTPSSSLCNNRRVLRTLRSSPVLRAVADEMIGVPIPRRARSASTKRLHEYRNSGSDGIGENLNHRGFSPTPAPASRIVSDGPAPPSSGVSMKKKKKMVSFKSVQPRARVLNGVSSSRLSSGIQDDIEIEVAEALFDLMKQSQSQSKKQENVDRDSRNTSDDVQNEQSIKVNDSMEEMKKEKFPGQELVSRDDGFVNKGNVGSPKEIESSSCVKVNACDIQYPTVTKPEYAAAVVETKKEAKLEIDLMAFPPLPSSPEIDALVDTATDPKVTTHDKIEAISRDSSVSAASQLVDEKIGAISCNQQQQDWKEQKNQPPLSFPIGMSGWPGVFPYPGYMLPPQAVLPIEESARTSTVMQLPRFKFSQPRSRRCATHQYIAQNIHHHQQLIKKSLSSGPTGASTSYETKPLNLQSLSPKQKVIPGNQLLGDIQNWATISGGSGKDKSSNIAADFTTTSNKLVLQQAPHQAPPNNVLPQTTAIGNISLPSNSAGRPSMSFNHPIFPSNEAASYMAMLQNNGCSVPISTNIPITSLKGSLKGSQSSAMPFFNSSFYSSRPFNVSQNMSIPSGSTSHKQPKHMDNNYPTSATTPLQQPEKPDTETTRKNGRSVNNVPAHSFPVQSMNFSIIPPGHKHSDIQQQGSKDRFDLIPQPFALSFGSNASTAPSLNFSSMEQNPAIFQGYKMAQQQLIQLQKHRMQQMQQVTGTASTPNTIPGSFIFSQFPVQTDNSSFPLPKSSQNQTHITFGNSSVQAASFQGQQIFINGQPSKNSGGSLRTGPTAGSTISALPSQETDGSSQKSSPTCRRNVPSILSTCPSQLPELKY
ncbi:hypothetical protein BUALT_Bualt02G0219500 [Buddleja alternifolia]|uniref:Time for coffee n=1 Tax=Buddleja alternifolia TaxID=168488 RepID=A0AAV6Y9D2_9LAMI|nr:hypothetical protein BUALT_Bualt02G0219500 [Buddleja alternifolia]